MENTVLLLQSGGRDSAAAAVKLLEKGNSVIGVTLAVNAKDKISLPKQRAIELADKYTRYQWHMVDFTEWDNLFKEYVTKETTSDLPNSCLLCLLSKITAIIPYCNNREIKKIAVGYTEYQSAWAEQTPLAIELQSSFLQALGIDLVLPVKDYSTKRNIEDLLEVRELTTVSLENPCCISKSGTQVVSEALIKEAVEIGFKYSSRNTPKIEIVCSVGTERFGHGA